MVARVEISLTDLDARQLNVVRSGVVDAIEDDLEALPAKRWLVTLRESKDTEA